MPVFAQENDYKPLSREEALAWVDSLEEDQLADFVIKWDFIEHSNPVFSMNYIVIVTDSDVAVIPSPEITPLIIGNANYNLSYDLNLPSYRYQGVINAQNGYWKGFGTGIPVGASLGAIITALVLKLVDNSK